MKNHQILLLQETWLFNFESRYLLQLDDDICAASKQVDDDGPIPPPPIQRPRGHAGIAILWDKKVDHAVSTISEGTSRILSIKINTDITPTLVICVYMPCKGGK
jgi:hypothetical protein